MRGLQILLPFTTLYYLSTRTKAAVLIPQLSYSFSVTCNNKKHQSTHLMIKKIVIGTVLSMLVFFSISFWTILFHINPLHHYDKNDSFKMEIGYPFVYHEQFLLNGDRIPNSGWKLDNLILDSLLTWIIVVGLYLIINKKNKQQVAIRTQN